MHTCNPNIQETETGGNPQILELTELHKSLFFSPLLPQKAAEVTVGKGTCHQVWQPELNP